jgi:hypothetical protein
MSIKNIFFAVMISSSFGINAQLTINATQIATYNEWGNLLSSNDPRVLTKDEYGKTVLNFNYIKGSPYENNKFLLGIIRDASNNKNTQMYMRYNIYADEIEVKTTLSSPEIKSLAKQYYINCTIDKKIYQYHSFTDKLNNTLEGYLIVLYQGKNYSLYKHLTSSFTPKQFAKSSINSEEPPTFDTKTGFYIKIGDAISSLPNKKKVLLNTFSVHRKKLKSYISKNRINLRKENKLLKLIKYLDGLN